MGLVLFQPISKLGGSSFTSSVRAFRSLIISDALLLSMGKFSAGVVATFSGLGVGKLSATGSSGEEFVVHFIEIRSSFRCFRGNEGNV